MLITRLKEENAHAQKVQRQLDDARESLRRSLSLDHYSHRSEAIKKSLLRIEKARLFDCGLLEPD